MPCLLPELGYQTWLVVGEALSVVTVGGGGWLAWRLVRAYERRGLEAARWDALAERVRRVEAAADDAEARAREALEAQRFTTRLLAECSARARGEG